MTCTNKTLLLLLCTLFSALSTAQSNQTERELISAEIATALQHYHQAFSSISPSEMADQIYGLPLLSVGANGSTTAWTSRAEIVAMLTGLVSNLKQQGWHRSSMPNPKVCVLGSRSGFASGQFIRYREDGTEISRSGMAYVFQKGESGWRMTTFLAHDADQSVSCSQ